MRLPRQEEVQMINHLYMQNFRGIAEGEIGDFAKINLLVGPNNTGKSTILEALYLMATADMPCFLASKEGDFIPVRISADTDLMGIHPMARVWKRHGFPPRWNDGPDRWEDGRIKLMKMPGPLHRYDFIEVEKDTRDDFAEGQEAEVALFAIQEMNPPRDTENPESEIAKNTDRKEDGFEMREMVFGNKAVSWQKRQDAFLWYPRFTYQMNGLAGWSVQGELPGASQTLFYDFHSASQHLSQNFIVGRGHECRRWLKRMGEHIRIIFDMSRDDVPYVTFMPEAGELRGYLELGDKLLPIDLWGDGTRCVFKIIAPLLVLTDDANEGKPGLLLWEDPELFLNPTALERLIREIIRIIGDKPIQMFITTQSMEVVAVFTDMLRKGDIPETDLKAFRLKIHEGKQIISKFKSRNLVAWLEDGMDPRVWDQGESCVRYRIGGQE